MKIIHIIPNRSGGGVETAAETCPEIKAKNFSYKIRYLLEKKNLGIFNKFLSYVSVFFYLKKTNPDIIICSLWKSAFFILFFKIFKPRTKLILFLHNNKSQHFLDFIFNYILIFISYRIWVDSNSTKKFRVPSYFKNKCSTISFILRDLPKKNFSRKVSPSFIFWGRLHKQKNLKLAIDIFQKIYILNNDARFLIIGSDAGEKKLLLNYVKELNLKKSVSFLDKQKFTNITKISKKYCFYLQSSHHEGMAMSVAEAMQLGLVPIVTNVGEIANYCINGQNAIFIMIDNIHITISKINRLLLSDYIYSQFSGKARNVWLNKPLYKESVFNACRKLVQMQAY